VGVFFDVVVLRVGLVGTVFYRHVAQRDGDYGGDRKVANKRDEPRVDLGGGAGEGFQRRIDSVLSSSAVPPKCCAPVVGLGML
jgi:hypothetical protein